MIFQCDKRAKPATRHFLTGARHLPSNRRHFTLIEMLVVIGIAGLLFALIGPAFNRMTRGNAVESHASGLKLGMERASSLAAASRRYVALLLPNGITDTSKDAYKYQRGGYRLAYVTLNDSGAYTFDGWLPDSEWQNRGGDAYLYSVSRASSISKPSKKITEDDYKTAITVDPSNVLYDVSLPNGGGPGKAVVFSPFGDARTPSAEVELIFLIAGVNTSETDYVTIRLNTLSGKVEFVDL